MNHKYLGLDPGPLTGWALWDSEANHFESGEIPYRQVKHLVRAKWGLHCPLYLITERFTITGRTVKGAVYYESLYVNGWLDLEYGDAVIWQMPAVAKRETDPPSKGGRSSAQLKRLGWHLKTKNGHANDAAAHIMSRAKADRQTFVLEGLAD